MSRYAIVVSTAPTDNKTHTSLAFAKALLDAGHRIDGIFFYQDGVLNANTFVQTPSDEVNMKQLWQRFHQQTKTPLHLCISAAERRGLTDSNDDDFYHNIVKEFTISGLGELAVLTAKADKVVQL
ncbi:sulfurtransferase complex subunit TusD [Thalassotalea maritima]|uniref:sulfurtransferase complex subunit TusD n=1 Tax=Thalassotalea maritima TaxID=3242416 RepID=UPI0035272715